MIKNLISVIFTEVKFLILKIMYRKRFSYMGIQRFSPETEISISGNGKLVLGSKVRAHTGTRIKVRDNAEVVVGNDVAFNYNCLIVSHEKIEIGDGCEIGPGVLFYDHDHDFHGKSIKEKNYKTSPITIGKNCWIGANAIILRGVTLGDNSVVAAGMVVRNGGVYPHKSLLYSDLQPKYKSIT